MANPAVAQTSLVITTRLGFAAFPRASISGTSICGLAVRLTIHTCAIRFTADSLTRSLSKQQRRSAETVAATSISQSVATVMIRRHLQSSLIRVLLRQTSRQVSRQTQARLSNSIPQATQRAEFS